MKLMRRALSFGNLPSFVDLQEEKLRELLSKTLILYLLLKPPLSLESALREKAKCQEQGPSPSETENGKRKLSD